MFFEKSKIAFHSKGEKFEKFWKKILNTLFIMFIPGCDWEKNDIDMKNKIRFTVKITF